MLEATDAAILNELFHVAMLAAPKEQYPPAITSFAERQCPRTVSDFALRQWARAFVRGPKKVSQPTSEEVSQPASGKVSQPASEEVSQPATESMDAKVLRVRDLVNRTFGEQIQRCKENIYYPRNPACRPGWY